MKLTREEICNHHIPRSYNPRLHAAACAATSLGTIGVSLLNLKAVGAWHMLTFAATIVVTNAGEYGLHRGPFHNVFRGRIGRFAKALYHRHTTMHHNMYDHETMAYESTRELKWILLPAWGFGAVLLVLSPAAAALYALGPNHMWMFLLATASYYAVYEVLHTAAHLPDGHWLTKNRLIQAATHHHRVHHNPKLMRRFNFNFALPLFDKLFGTQYREPARRDEVEDEATVGATQRAR